MYYIPMYATQVKCCQWLYVQDGNGRHLGFLNMLYAEGFKLYLLIIIFHALFKK